VLTVNFKTELSLLGRRRLRYLHYLASLELRCLYYLAGLGLRCLHYLADLGLIVKKGLKILELEESGL
jgi:hypothetical protein